MSAHRRLASRAYLPEHPDQGRAAKAGESNIAEDIHKGPELGLVSQLLVQLHLAGRSRIRRIGPMAEVTGESVDILLEPVARTGDRASKIVLMKVGTPGQHGLRE